MATTIEDLEERVNSLEDALTEMAKTNVVKTEKIDNTSNKVDHLTPTVITKQAYIDDTEVVFTNVPSGNITVYVENENGDFLNYSISRVTDMITVSFEKPLEYTATVTLSIL